MLKDTSEKFDLSVKINWKEARGYTLTAIAVFFFVVSGALSTVFYSLQHETTAKGCGGVPPKPFSHSTTQCLLMFSGELVCFIIHLFIRLIEYIKSLKKKKVGEEEFGSVVFENLSMHSVDGSVPSPSDIIYGADKKRTTASSFVYAIPAALDLANTTVSLLGLYYTFSFVYSLLSHGGLCLLFFSLISILVIKQKIYPHHMLGIAYIIIGTILIVIDGLFFNIDETNPYRVNDFMVGAMFLFFSALLQAAQFSIEEGICKSFKFSTPFRFCGWEGFWGCIFSVLLLFVLYYFPGEDCGSFESFAFAFSQFLDSPIIVTFVILSIISSAVFNYHRILMIQRLGAASTFALDTLRTLVVFIIEIARSKETFQTFQFTGLLFHFIGCVIYTRLIRILYYDDWFKSKRKLLGLYYPTIVSNLRKEKIESTSIIEDGIYTDSSRDNENSINFA